MKRLVEDMKKAPMAPAIMISVNLVRAVIGSRLPCAASIP